MSTATVTTFFALLAVLCQLYVLTVVVLAVAGRVADGPARALDSLRAELDRTGLWLAFAIAAVATLGSLYLSEVAHFIPCRLCWFQRIAMYPLSLVLGIAAWRRDRGIRTYAIPLAAVGAGISVLHILVERFPSIEQATSCDPANPCSLKWVEHLGYVTIPTMALSGFLAIITTLALLPREPS